MTTTNEKNIYAKFVMFYTIAITSLIFALILTNGVLNALGCIFLDNTVIIALISFLGVNVLGVFIAMMNDLFKTQGV